MHVVLIHSKFDDLDLAITNVNPDGPKLMGETVVDVHGALESGGHTVTKIEADHHLLSKLEKVAAPDLLFNLSSGVSDKRTQANIVGMLEMTGIPMLGSGLATHVIGLHKEITKSILAAHNVRTARFQLVGDENDKIREDFVYPLIVKPEHEGSGIGVTASSKVDTPEQLQKIIKEKLDLHQQVLLVEEFLPGREFTVGVMGNHTLEILPIKETIFHKDGPQLLTNDLKLSNTATSAIPADISPDLKEEIEIMVEKTYRVLRCQDFARIDLRLDGEGRPHVIELNTFPGLGKRISYFPLIAKAAGYDYEQLINRLVEIALEPKGFR
ncbi:MULTISPECIES: D-alanine--D-alanine ligase family protein [unclassified Jeotgalibaca]|uniref:D-alanine--D-alanine ligase family protein n=1 Tax=unclassified Jeotgalibaca TaxID=2621505 RepID=UPI003FD0FA5E